MDNNTSLLTRTTKINLVMLCLGFLFFISLTIIKFLPVIMAMIAGAMILAYLLLGPVKTFSQFLDRVLPRLSPSVRKTIAIALVYLMLLGLVAVALVRVIPALTYQIKDFSQNIPQYLSHVSSKPAPKAETPHLSDIVEQTLEENRASQPAGQIKSPAATRPTSTSQPAAQIKSQTTPKKGWMAATSQLATQQLAEIYRRYASRLGGLILDIGSTALSGLIYLLTTLVLVFILLHDGPRLKAGFIGLMPSRSEAGVADLLRRLHLQLYNFTKAQAVMSVTAGTLMYLLLLLLQVKYALLWGVIFGCASVLPIIGAWLGLLPIVLFIAFGLHPEYIVHVLLSSGLFYLIKTYWLWPKLIQRQYDIHPIIFIITFMACLNIVGYLGILLSFPIASAIGVVLESLKNRHNPQSTGLPESP